MGQGEETPVSTVSSKGLANLKGKERRETIQLVSKASLTELQWNISRRTPLGPAMQSFVIKEIVLFQRQILHRVCMHEYFLLVLCWESICPLSECL